MQQIGCFILLVFFALTALIAFAQNFPFAFKILLGITIAASIIFLIYKDHRKKRDASAAEQLRKEAEEIALAQAEQSRKAEYEKEQRQLRTSLESCIEELDATAKKIHRRIDETDNALEQAEREFSEGAFAPFWDAVERAANLLAESNSGINEIARRSMYYGDAVIKLDSVPPPFKVALDTLPDTTRVAAKMKAIVRKAQKDFQFATIYEQRKTNKLLISGFTNLAEAFTQMSDRLELSLDSLSEALLNIAETDRANTEELIASIQKIDAREALDSEARREHERKHLEILDNIQRKRKPRRVYPETFE